MQIPRDQRTDTIPCPQRRSKTELAWVAADPEPEARAIASRMVGVIGLLVGALQVTGVNEATVAPLAEDVVSKAPAA